MALINRNLLLSIKNDLTVLNRLNEEILKYLPHFGSKSWRYPTKNFNEVPETDLSYIDARGNSYTLLLEYTVDKLYLFINLLVKFFETFPSQSEKYEQCQRNIERPKNLSLGSSVNLLWNKIVQHKEFLIDYQKKENANVKRRTNSDVEAQTETYSSLMCSSCDTANACIKRIFYEMDRRMKSNLTEKVREDLQDEIFEITKNGCMNRLTVTIEMNYKSLLVQLDDITTKCRYNEKELLTLTKKQCESSKKIKSLQTSLTRIRKRFRNTKRRNEALLKLTDKLMQTNQQIQHEISQKTRKTEILHKILKENTTTLALMANDNERLQKEIGQILNENVNASNERSMWKDRFSDMYLENRELNKKLKEIQSLLNVMDKIKERCESIAVKLELSNEEIKKRGEVVENLIKVISEVADFDKIKDYKRVITMKNTKTNIMPKFLVIGDPIADMKKQIEENNCTIRKLKQYNIDLLQTIERVQARALYT